jgi:nucleoside-diphosphate kinase
MPRTLMIIKPDAVSRNQVGEIIRRAEGAGFRLVEMKMVRLSRSQAAEFYEVHREKPFYADLLSFMTSDRVVPMVLERENAVAHLRTVIGATDPAKAEAGTIRRDFATSVQNNAVHASDSPENAAREIAFFFGASALGG